MILTMTFHELTRNRALDQALGIEPTRKHARDKRMLPRRGTRAGTLFAERRRSFSSRSFAVVAPKDAAEFGLAANMSLGHWNEFLIEHRVVSADSSMRTLFVIIFQPHPKDIVQMPAAETDEVIQHFVLHFPDIRFDERVCLSRLRRNSDASHARLPESIELVGVLSVPIPDQKPGLDALVLHPHRGVARLPVALSIWNRDDRCLDCETLSGCPDE